MGPDPLVIRSYEVGMSVEALAGGWARQESAPEGAVVVVGREVAGRLRGGEPWAVGGADALLLAMVARPTIDPMQEALLWVPASLAAADALGVSSAAAPSVRWPDRVGAGPDGTPWCVVNVVTQLGPGRVEHSIFSARVDRRALRASVGDAFDDDGFIEAFVAAACRHVRVLERDPNELLDSHVERCDLLGQRVVAELRPRGEARGRAVAVDADGFLAIESPTGMLERIAPATLRSLRVVDRLDH